MVQAWYMKDQITNQKDPNHLDPPKFISLEQLKRKTGVEYWEIDADNFEKNELLDQIRNEKGYDYMDEITISKDTLPNYDEMLKRFFTEHLHESPEIRYVIDGSGYFDIRDIDDKWIRVHVTKNDLITLPTGIYHRFTLDENDYAKVKRLNVGTPEWRALDRPADTNPARTKYLELAKVGFTA